MKGGSPGSPLLPKRSVRAENVSVSSHVALLRSGGVTLAVKADGVPVPALQRLRPRAAATDPGAEVPGVLIGGDQSVPRRVSLGVPRGADPAEGHAARTARPD